MKIVCGLGNPGPEYGDTRHNAGWWLLGQLAEDWEAGAFRAEGEALVAEARVGGGELRLLAPLTYMNRSGLALGPYLGRPGFDPSRDLLVLVDDVALEAGRARLRTEGSAGGHNGLKSIEQTLGTRTFARLRIGVGVPPPGSSLVDWVLARPGPGDEARIAALLQELVPGVRLWAEEEIEAAMRHCNR